MRYILEGLDCARCASEIEKELHKVEGMEGVSINFATRSLELPVNFLETAASIIAQIEPGIQLKQISPSARPSSEAKGSDQKDKLRLITSLVLFLIGVIFNEPLHRTPYSWLEYIVLLIPYFLVGWPVIIKAYRKISRGQLFDENFLMAVATLGAIAIHQLGEAAGVMLFYRIGLYYQEKAVNRSRRSIRNLLDVQPEYANLLEEGRARMVKPEEVGVGRTILIKPGEKVPLDGEVLEGESFVDTSVLTGESTPRSMKAGETILAGMINGQGLLKVKVSKPYNEASVARIIHLVEQAAERKAPIEQLVTVLARYYAPVVVGIALLIVTVPPLVISGATFGDWVYRALVLLVISCPCALMVSIPLGYFGGLGAASKVGILVKGANFFDGLSRLHTVVFDKTGTLTKGVFRVTEIVPKNGYSKEELIAIAAGAEIYSNHPIARSIREAGGMELRPARVENYQEVPAHGICATVDGKEVLVGNDLLMHCEGIEHQDCRVEGTSVYIAVDGKYAGYIVISDELKEDAHQTVDRLKALGVRKIYMLTGDDESVARSVAEKLGLDGWYADLLPEQKVERLEELLHLIPDQKKQKLAFVGDGINDAPVITRADLGVAMGALGSDAAMEAADIVLMEDKLSKLPTAVEVARRTHRIVYQNIYMALGVKVFFLLLGTFGVADIWEAVFADVGVTLLAVFNAMRTMRLKM